MLKKIKLVLVSMLFWVLSGTIFAFSLTESVDIYQRNNTAILYYNLENISNYLVFNSDREAKNFVDYMVKYCDDLNHMDGKMIIHPDKERLEYVYSTALIKRIKYIIAYANPLMEYPDTPEGLKENYYNKQYYRKSIATGENTSLNVTGSIKNLLRAIIYDGVFDEELLDKYNIPIPENHGVKYNMGYGYVIKENK